jgi:hypothetical protein
MDRHTAIKYSKYLKYKKEFKIYKVSIYIKNTKGKHRLCFIPYLYSEKYYPPNAKNAVLLAPHKYMLGHLGYRPLSPNKDEYKDTTHYNT